jgi:hypothetical protein
MCYGLRLGLEELTAVRNLAPFNLGSRRGYVTGLSTQIVRSLIEGKPLMNTDETYCFLSCIRNIFE